MIKEIKKNIKKISQDEGIHFNRALALIASERVIVRFSQSKTLSDCLIYKGGLIMRLIHGSKRYTKDLDASFKNLGKNTLKKEIEKYIKDDLNDGFSFSETQWSKIQDSKEYDGLRLTCKIFFEGNYIQKLQVDFTLSEYALENNYFMYSGLEQSIVAFSTELIMAEKIQILIKRKDLNTRSKDIFDINYLFNQKIFDPKKLKLTIESVFKKRQTQVPESFFSFVNSISTDSLSNSWNSLVCPKNEKLSFVDSWSELIKNMKKLDILMESKIGK